MFLLGIVGNSWQYLVVNITGLPEHEHWTRSDLKRPITIQTHIDPVPERIMKQIVIALGIDKNEFKQIIKNS